MPWMEFWKEPTIKLFQIVRYYVSRWPCRFSETEAMREIIFCEKHLGQKLILEFLICIKKETANAVSLGLGRMPCAYLELVC
jgi:hypothetical protein